MGEVYARNRKEIHIGHVKYMYLGNNIWLNASDGPVVNHQDLLATAPDNMKELINGIKQNIDKTPGAIDNTQNTPLAKSSLIQEKRQEFYRGLSETHQELDNRRAMFNKILSTFELQTRGHNTRTPTLTPGSSTDTRGYTKLQP